ncbi:MAG: hypothetical protein ACNS60_14065 [Candidatus Cyclobacteriaceae bacterium M2_1C_046]
MTKKHYFPKNTDVYYKRKIYDVIYVLNEKEHLRCKEAKEAGQRIYIKARLVLTPDGKFINRDEGNKMNNNIDSDELNFINYVL